MLPVIIIVGLRFGIFTPTEAAVVVAVYSLFVATCIYRELKWTQLYEVFVSAALSTSVVMFLVAAALVSSWLITVAEIAGQVVDLVRPFMGNQTLLLLVIMIIVVIVGTALDMTPTILILTPILMPIVKQAGIDPVYFGVLFIINNAIGLITPPVGVVLNVVCGVSRVSMEDSHQGRVALHDRPTRRAALACAFPVAGDRTSQVAWRLIEMRRDPRSTIADRNNIKRTQQQSEHTMTARLMISEWSQPQSFGSARTAHLRLHDFGSRQEELRGVCGIRRRPPLLPSIKS